MIKLLIATAILLSTGCATVDYYTPTINTQCKATTKQGMYDFKTTIRCPDGFNTNIWTKEKPSIEEQ